MLLTFFSFFLVLLAVCTALSKSLLRLILLLSASSIVICICYLLMDAPDVAMTEAAIGACLSTIILLRFLNLCYPSANGSLGIIKLDSHHRWGGIYLKIFAITVCLFLGACFLYASQDMPLYGDPNAPAQTHINQYFLQNTKNEIGTPSFVAAILASYRGYDTLGETTVILIAVLVILMIMRSSSHPHQEYSAPSLPELTTHPILRLVSAFIIPYILFYTLYIQINGEVSPGGGFQAGAIFASAIILRSFFKKQGELVHYYILAIMGVVIYAGTGLVTMLMGGSYLEYSALNINPHLAQKIGIMAIEFGVGVTVSASMSLIYFLFKEE